MSSAPGGISRTTRVRASETAIKAALKAMREVGLSVKKLCVTGGQVEIHAGSVESEEPLENDGRLKPW